MATAGEPLVSHDATDGTSDDETKLENGLHESDGARNGHADFPPQPAARKSIGDLNDDELDEELDALEAEAATYGRAPAGRGAPNALARVWQPIADGVDFMRDNSSLIVAGAAGLVGLLLLVMLIRSFFTYRGSATDSELDSTSEPSLRYNAIVVNRTSTFNGVVKTGPGDEIKPVQDMPPSEVTTCQYDSSDMVRYAPLTDGREGPILLAMNLFDNENVLPTILRELPRLIQYIGPHNVHVSIYENGSKDRTVELIKHLAWWLHSLGTSYTIHATGEAEQSHKEEGHRIHVLADLRNKLIAPLHDRAVVNDSPFRTVLFLNDIQFCITDVLEVLLQKRMQRADLAFATDYNFAPPRFYDQWVTRDMDGYTIYNKTDWETNVMPLPFPHREADRDRYYKLRPIQMFSGWNGIAAFSANAFMAPHNIQFRTSHDTSRHSECLLVSVDLWKAGLGRIIMTPRSRVAYNVGDYNSAKSMGHVELDVYRQTGAWDAETEKIDFQAEPPSTLLLYPDGWWGSGSEEDWRTIR